MVAADVALRVARWAPGNSAAASKACAGNGNGAGRVRRKVLAAGTWATAPASLAAACAGWATPCVLTSALRTGAVDAAVVVGRGVRTQAKRACIPTQRELSKNTLSHVSKIF
jgi:coenzyme F420-reducing hydrogenase beta subunit